jgi:hypothetical protein
MTLRHVSGALTAVVLISGLLTVAPARAQRDASLLPPEEHGTITVAGCLQMGGKHGDEWVLASPRLGPIANVPVGTCNSPVDERALDLKDTEDFGINQSMLGHLVEVNGDLEKEEDNDLSNLREIEIRSFRMLPVVPQRAEAAPVRQPEYTPAPEPIAPPQEPVGTTGVEPEPALPKTASPLHLMGLLGMLSLAGGLGLRFYR